MLDEEAMRTAMAIFRKEKTEGRRKRSAAADANEINILVAQIEELRKEVGKIRCENERLKKFICCQKAERNGGTVMIYYKKNFNCDFLSEQKQDEISNRAYGKKNTDTERAVF